LDLLGRERRIEQFSPLMKRPEEVYGKVHALLQVGPVFGAAVIQRTFRLEAFQHQLEFRIVDCQKPVWKGMVQVPSKRNGYIAWKT
jgi:hypothetical protein